MSPRLHRLATGLPFAHQIRPLRWTVFIRPPQVWSTLDFGLNDHLSRMPLPESAFCCEVQAICSQDCCEDGSRLPTTPVIDDDLRILERDANCPIDQLVPKPTIEALAVPFLPRTVWFDERRPTAQTIQPLSCCLGSERLLVTASGFRVPGCRRPTVAKPAVGTYPTAFARAVFVFVSC